MNIFGNSLVSHLESHISFPKAQFQQSITFVEIMAIPGTGGVSDMTGCAGIGDPVYQLKE